MAHRGRGKQLFGGIRRLIALADSARDQEAIYRALARELLTLSPAGDEVHVHHVALHGEEREELGRRLPLRRRGAAQLPSCHARERPLGVSWVASTGRSFLASAQRGIRGHRAAARADRPGQLRAARAPRGPRRGARGGDPRAPLLGRAHDRRAVEHAMRAGGTGWRTAPRARARARAEAGTDAVTGGLNHRAMRRRLREEIDRASRTAGQLSCLLIDLDDFKAVNDVYGHAAGDALLREVVQALVGEFRAFDRVARYGGDEFVVILPNADLDAAAAAGARALARLSAIPGQDGGEGGVSASIGACPVAPRRWGSTSCSKHATRRSCAPSVRARAASRAPAPDPARPAPYVLAARTLRDCSP